MRPSIASPLVLWVLLMAGLSACHRSAESEASPALREAAAQLAAAFDRGQCRAEVRIASGPALNANLECSWNRRGLPADQKEAVEATAWLMLIGNRNVVDLPALFEDVPELVEVNVSLRMIAAGAENPDQRAEDLVSFRFDRQNVERVPALRAQLVQYLKTIRRTEGEQSTEATRLFLARTRVLVGRDAIEHPGLGLPQSGKPQLDEEQQTAIGGGTRLKRPVEPAPTGLGRDAASFVLGAAGPGIPEDVNLVDPKAEPPVAPNDPKIEDSAKTAELSPDANVVTEAPESVAPVELPFDVIQFAPNQVAKSALSAAKELTTELMTPRPEAAPVPVPRASIQSIMASSRQIAHTKGSRHYDFSAERLIDGELKTCWQEGEPGAGEGAFVELELATPVDLRGLELANGFQWVNNPDYGDLFRSNGVATRVAISLDDRAPTHHELTAIEGFQRLEVQGNQVKRVKITIESATRGTRWSDTSLSELRLLAAPRP